MSVPIEKIHDYAALGKYGGYIGFVTNFLLLEVAGVGRIAATIIFAATFLISMLLLFELSLGEIMRAIIPEIKIEVAKEKASRGRTARGIFKEEDEGDGIPEILIHKNKIKAHESVEVVPGEASSEEVAIKKNDDSDVEESLDKGVEQVDDDFEWEFPSLDLLKVGYLPFLWELLSVR